jgi:hypothetical protein
MNEAFVCGILTRITNRPRRVLSEIGQLPVEGPEITGC